MYSGGKCWGMSGIKDAMPRLLSAPLLTFSGLMENPLVGKKLKS